MLRLLSKGFTLPVAYGWWVFCCALTCVIYTEYGPLVFDTWSLCLYLYPCYLMQPDCQWCNIYIDIPEIRAQVKAGIWLINTFESDQANYELPDCYSQNSNILIASQWVRICHWNIPRWSGKSDNPNKHSWFSWKALHLIFNSGHIKHTQYAWWHHSIKPQMFLHFL